MKVAAKFFSIAFHPLLMPLIGLLIIFNTDTYVNYAVPYELKKAVLLLVTVSTFVIPFLITLLLKNRGYINSLEMETTKERVIPYAFTIVFYIFTLYMLKQAHIPPVIFKFIIGATFSVIMAFVINIKWKISAHMIGLGGLIGALICISLIMEVFVTPYILISLVAAGLVGSSRLILKAHDLSQIFAGFFLGVLCQVITLYY